MKEAACLACGHREPVEGAPGEVLLRCPSCGQFMALFERSAPQLPAPIIAEFAALKEDVGIPLAIGATMTKDGALLKCPHCSFEGPLRRELADDRSDIWGPPISKSPDGVLRMLCPSCGKLSEFDFLAYCKAGMQEMGLPWREDATPPAAETWGGCVRFLTWLVRYVGVAAAILFFARSSMWSGALVVVLVLGHWVTSHAMQARFETNLRAGMARRMASDAIPNGLAHLDLLFFLGIWGMAIYAVLSK